MEKGRRRRIMLKGKGPVHGVDEEILAIYVEKKWRAGGIKYTTPCIGECTAYPRGGKWLLPSRLSTWSPLAVQPAKPKYPIHKDNSGSIKAWIGRHETVDPNNATY